MLGMSLGSFALGLFETETQAGGGTGNNGNGKEACKKECCFYSAKVVTSLGENEGLYLEYLMH